jgi:hypothetical protein
LREKTKKYSDEYIIFTESNSILLGGIGVNIELMIRKITLLLLLFIGLNSVAKAQVVLDSVTIYMPIGTDTTCPGTQLEFYAMQSNDTFSHVEYHWYTNSTYTGVIIDTFKTTAMADGDTAWCNLVYRNSLGVIDSFTSNLIIIHRSTSFAPRVTIALTVGRNPDCEGHPLTFTAFPVNGGTSPSYQWLIDGLPVPARDSVTFTGIFNDNDTISVLMISNSTCSAPFNDTVLSDSIIVSHDSLHATVSIVTMRNPICAGTRDTFDATFATAGIGAYLAWYVDTTRISTVLGLRYITDSLRNGDLVYAILHAPDACITNHTTTSNIITMTVISLAPTSAYDIMTAGANPGCLSDPVTFTGHFLNFGTSPTFDWYVNGVLVLHDDSVFTSTFNNGDLVTYKVNATDNGCYLHDTVTTPARLMLRDSTPTTPWLSLISDQLVANNRGRFIWYFNTISSYTGPDMMMIPGANTDTWVPHDCGYYWCVKDTTNCPSLPSNIIYTCLLEVKNVALSQVKIYPNPTSGLINLDWGTTVVNMQVDVYNIIGQPILHEEIKNQSHHETDLSHLPDGNYMVVLRDESGNKATYKVYLKR